MALGGQKCGKGSRYEFKMGRAIWPVHTQESICREALYPKNELEINV